MNEHANPAGRELLALAPGYAGLQAAEARLMFPGDSRLTRGDRLGFVQLVGVLSKRDQVAARQEINALAGDERVREIFLLVDSPGGTVAGCYDLAESVARAAKAKRVTAFVEDLGASAAYFAACGATEIICNATAKVGSLGVLLVLLDVTGAMERQGLRPVVVQSGPNKGVGAEGLRITPQQIEVLQHEVDVLANTLAGLVVRGRKLSAERVRDLSDGRVFIGREAMAAGLVDRIGTLETEWAAALHRAPDERYKALHGEEARKKRDELLAAAFDYKGQLPPAECRGRYLQQLAAEEPTLVENAAAHEEKYRADCAARREL